MYAYSVAVLALAFSRRNMRPSLKRVPLSNFNETKLKNGPCHVNNSSKKNYSSERKGQLARKLEPPSTARAVFGHEKARSTTVPRKNSHVDNAAAIRRLPRRGHASRLLPDTQDSPHKRAQLFSLFCSSSQRSGVRFETPSRVYRETSFPAQTVIFCPPRLRFFILKCYEQSESGNRRILTFPGGKTRYKKKCKEERVHGGRLRPNEYRHDRTCCGLRQREESFGLTTRALVCGPGGVGKLGELDSI